MTSDSESSDQEPCREYSIAKIAMGILAVDGIKVSDHVREMLYKCEAGMMTFDEARADVISRARAMASAQNKKQGEQS